MATTFIDTRACTAVRQPDGQGEMAEILNRDLCGARNVVGKLRWLGPGESIDARCASEEHQLLYLMAGEGVISLQGKDYDVGKGAGVYLGPLESARVRHAGAGQLKLFHLVVPAVRD